MGDSINFNDGVGGGDGFDSIKMNDNVLKFSEIDTLSFENLSDYGGTPFCVSHEWRKIDNVNKPPHYTKGKVEAIEVIEDAIGDAPNPMQGFLQGQVLKYMLRMWLKDNVKEDAQKAEWYLKKLIDSL